MRSARWWLAWTCPLVLILVLVEFAVERESLAYWSLIAVGTVLAGTLWVASFRDERPRRRRKRGLCPACGYDLRASKDRCPECGRVVEDAGKSR